MPNISGFEVLAELKYFELTQDISVILITGASDTEDVEKGVMLGAVDYITKPFCDSIIKERVKMHLQIIENNHTIRSLCMVNKLMYIK